MAKRRGQQGEGRMARFASMSACPEAVVSDRVRGARANLASVVLPSHSQRFYWGTGAPRPTLR